MHRGDASKINDVIWTLIVQGVILPGSGDHNPNLPFLHITEYGHQCLAEASVLPHDPDGYLAQLKDSIPHIDDLIIMYITESLQTFLTGNYLACSVMLGVASEQAFLLLFNAFKDALASGPERANIERAEKKQIKVRFDEFRKRFKPKTGQIPPALTEDISIAFDSVFNWIRVFRNDSGHPTGRIVKREEAFASLQLFVVYINRVYALIDHFNSVPRTLR